VSRSIFILYYILIYSEVADAAVDRLRDKPVGLRLVGYPQPWAMDRQLLHKRIVRVVFS